MQRRSYPSDLSEREWAILEPLIPAAKPGEHPRTTDMREVLNAMRVPGSHGRPMEGLAARLPTLVDGVELFPKMAQ